VKRLLILFLCLASAPVLADTWSHLWSTPDQRAQRLLDQHRPAEAAKLFTDPRRRAYAEIAAGHYPQAAELLKPFSDVDSQYNRGNALARGGQLQDALTAYDAALKQAPGNADIRHNRDLVARALEQQNKNPQQQGDRRPGAGQQQDPSGRGKSSQRNSSQRQQSQGSQSDEKSPDQPSKQASDAHGDHAGNSSQSSSSEGSSARSDAGASQGTQPPAAAARNQTGNSGSTASSQSGSAEQQAQHDAAAAVQAMRGQSASSSSGPGREAALAQDQPGNARTQADALPPRKPPSEQSLALDQWLRSIPEDSGELLRRKFLIEHMIKQQQDTNP
jgi:Ca-activated chloride channel family protein